MRLTKIQQALLNRAQKCLDRLKDMESPAWLKAHGSYDVANGLRRTYNLSIPLCEMLVQGYAEPSRAKLDNLTELAVSQLEVALAEELEIALMK
jgi:hypothetical protein